MPRASVPVRNGSERARLRSEGRTWGSTRYLLSHLTAICVVKGLGPSRLVVALRPRPNCRQSYLPFETVFRSCNVPKSPS